MTTEPQNGTAFTQKEMLVRIDGKLDTVAAHLTAVELELAVHKAQPLHSDAPVLTLAEEVANLRRGQESINRRVSMAAGAVAVIVTLAPFVFRWLGG